MYVLLHDTKPPIVNQECVSCVLFIVFNVAYNACYVGYTHGHLHNRLPIIKLTFTVSQDCVTIPIRVNPVIPVNRLISFTVRDLAARFSRKLFNGAKRNCAISKETIKKNDIFFKIVHK